MMDVYTLDVARSRLVVKDNDLILKARYDLTVNQQKIIAYVISLIKPTDIELQQYEISVGDFCTLCGLDKAHVYSEIREIVDNLDNKACWIETKEKIFKFRWFSEVEIIKGTGKINIRLNSNIKKYLIGLSERFTQYELYNILALKSKYSIRLYEWFKTYSFVGEKKIDIKELKHKLEAENYTEFKAFRRRVIEPAMKEINTYTDLDVSYIKVMRGKRVTDLIFEVHFKEQQERYNTYCTVVNRLDRR